MSQNKLVSSYHLNPPIFYAIKDACKMLRNVLALDICFFISSTKLFQIELYIGQARVY